MRRSRIGRGDSRRTFTRTAGSHPKNFGGASAVMRGGIRL